MFCARPARPRPRQGVVDPLHAACSGLWGCRYCVALRASHRRGAAASDAPAPSPSPSLHPTAAHSMREIWVRQEPPGDAAGRYSLAAAAPGTGGPADETRADSHRRSSELNASGASSCAQCLQRRGRRVGLLQAGAPSGERLGRQCAARVRQARAGRGGAGRGGTPRSRARRSRRRGRARRRRRECGARSPRRSRGRACPRGAPPAARVEERRSAPGRRRAGAARARGRAPGTPGVALQGKEARQSAGGRRGAGAAGRPRAVRARAGREQRVPRQPRAPQQGAEWSGRAQHRPAGERP